MLKVRERANGKRGLLTRAGLPGGEGERLDEWGHLTGVGPPSGDEEKLIETQKNKTTNQVFIEKGPFKFTFRKEVAKVIENEVKKGGLSKAKRILSENIERENKTSKLPTEELEDGGKLKKIEIMIEMMIEEIVIEGEKRIEEKMKSREIRKFRAKEKQSELKGRLVNRAVETLIQKVVDKIEWRNDIEEEIGKDREREKIQECTENILRKRKSNKKLKYKVKKMEGSVEKGESKEICDKKHRKYEKARRRKKETEKIKKEENEEIEKNQQQEGGKPHKAEGERKKEKDPKRKKETGIKKKRSKKKEILEDRKRLQEGMKNWLQNGGSLGSKHLRVKTPGKTENKKETLKVPEKSEKVRNIPDQKLKKYEGLQACGRGRIKNDSELTKNRNKVEQKLPEERELLKKLMRVPEKGESVRYEEGKLIKRSHGRPEKGENVNKIAAIFGERVWKKKEIEKKKEIDLEKEMRKKVIQDKVRLYEKEREKEKEKLTPDRKYKPVTEKNHEVKERGVRKDRTERSGDTDPKEQKFTNKLQYARFINNLGKKNE